MGRIALTIFSLIWGGAITLATVCGLAGSWWWRFELLDHFRWQYCWLLAIPLLIGLWQRQRWSLVWLVPLAINGALILSLAWPGWGRMADGPTLTVLHANIDHKNFQPFLF